MSLDPVPADFPACAAVMRNHELAELYIRGGSTIRRWRNECGVPSPFAKCRRSMPVGFDVDAHTLCRNQLRVKYRTSLPKVDEWCSDLGITPKTYTQAKRAATVTKIKEVPIRDTSEAGLAADYLQKISAIYRCDANGAPDPSGSFWRRGKYILNAAGVIECAAEAKRFRESLAA